MEKRPRPRLSRTLRFGIVYLVVCLIAGVLLLFYALRSVVADIGNS